MFNKTVHHNPCPVFLRLRVCCLKNTLFLISEGITFPSTAAPEFAPAPFNVSFLVGDLAVLTCRVYNLGTKKVIPWIMQYYMHEPNKNDLIKQMHNHHKVEINIVQQFILILYWLAILSYVLYTTK